MARAPRLNQSAKDLTVIIQSRLASDEADKFEKRVATLRVSKAAYIRSLILRDLGIVAS